MTFTSPDDDERLRDRGRIPVLIVGTGPVGLALASDLGWRGINCIVVEKGEAWMRSPRIMQISVRTMEFCRRFGIAEQVKNWGFPRDFPLDNVFVTPNLNGYGVSRIKMPTMAEMQPSIYSPEHQTHCPQTYFDPIWRALASSFPTVDIRFGHELLTFEQDDAEVRATIKSLADDRIETIVADYLVGCDGYASTVRDELRIPMRGMEKIDDSLSIEFKARDLARFHPHGNAGRFVCMDAGGGTWATCMAVDGVETWRCLLYGVTDVNAVDPDDVIRRIVGRDFPFELIAAKPWTRRALVADRFSDGRVFLAGDSAHTHPPNGGFGMNTGLADAMDLGWKLEAVIEGWAPPSLLATYDIERRPVCHRVVDQAIFEFRRLTGITRSAAIDEGGQAGDDARRAMDAKLHAAFDGNKGWNRFGIHLGYIYDPSPITVDDGTPVPFDDTFGYAPTSRPGARAPHAYLSDGQSILDLFGRSYVLLRLGENAPDGDMLREYADEIGMPLAVHRIDDPEIAALYELPLVLVRPDGHVAWRGRALTWEGACWVIDRIRGAGVEGAARVRVPA